jgi:hypothetical protein
MRTPGKFTDATAHLRRLVNGTADTLITASASNLRTDRVTHVQDTHEQEEEK